MFLIEGPRAILQIIRTHPNSVQEILIDESFEMKYSFEKNVRILSSRQFTSIAPSKSPQGVLAIVSMPSNLNAIELPETYGSKILLLEKVQDPGNIGTLIRTAVAFNFSGVLLSATCADPFSPKAIQASAGSILSIWIRRTDHYCQLLQTLKSKGFSIVATDTKGSINNTPLKKRKIIIALGSEGNGLSEKVVQMADNVFTISYNTNSIESLNVAVAGAICMYLTKE